LEPSHFTGFREATPSDQLGKLFSAVYGIFADCILEDAEVLYVVGVIASISSWLLGGDGRAWEA